jgi:hypothetical protein
VSPAESLTDTAGGVHLLLPMLIAVVCVLACVCFVACVQVSEQVDSLRVLFTDPVDYLVTPRVLASMIAGPILNVLCFCMGELTELSLLKMCDGGVNVQCVMTHTHTLY